MNIDEKFAEIDQHAHDELSGRLAPDEFLDLFFTEVYGDQAEQEMADSIERVDWDGTWTGISRVCWGEDDVLEEGGVEAIKKHITDLIGEG